MQDSGPSLRGGGCAWRDGLRSTTLHARRQRRGGGGDWLAAGRARRARTGRTGDVEVRWCAHARRVAAPSPQRASLARCDEPTSVITLHLCRAPPTHRTSTTALPVLPFAVCPLAHILPPPSELLPRAPRQVASSSGPRYAQTGHQGEGLDATPPYSTQQGPRPLPASGRLGVHLSTAASASSPSFRGWPVCARARLHSSRAATLDSSTAGLTLLGTEANAIPNAKLEKKNPPSSTLPR